MGRSPSMSNHQGRLVWVDAAKGIGIALVVFGHSGLGLINAGLAPESGPLSASIRWIYLFHMPLFFWLSGLFAKPKLKSPLPSYFSLILRAVVYPYIVWASLQICVQSLFSHLTNEPASITDLMSVFTRPSRQYWFLYVLALVKCAHWLLARAFRSDWVVFAASAGLHLVVPLILPGAWSPLLLTFHFLPLVTSATLLAPHLHLLSKVPGAWCFVLALACFGFVIYSPTFLSFEEFLPPQALVGVAGVVLTTVALSRYALVALPQTLGAASLEIYVAHTMVSAGFRIALLQMGITNVSVHLIGGTLVGIVFPLLLRHWMNTLDFPYLFTLRRSPSTPKALHSSRS